MKIVVIELKVENSKLANHTHQSVICNGHTQIYIKQKSLTKRKEKDNHRETDKDTPND